MGWQGSRVLALAEGTVPHPLDPSQTPPEPAHLTFLGFVGMIDPLRPGVRDAVAACHQAGVTVSIVTGAELAGRSSVELEAAFLDGEG